MTGVISAQRAGPSREVESLIRNHVDINAPANPLGSEDDVPAAVVQDWRAEGAAWAATGAGVPDALRDLVTTPATQPRDPSTLEAVDFVIKVGAILKR
jgi:hypothetical protein